MNEEPLFAKQWIVSSEFGQEKIVMEDVAEIIERFDSRSEQKEDILTTVSESCLNAIEHGNKQEKQLPVRVTMNVFEDKYIVCVYDEGKGFDYSGPQGSDRELQAERTSRGWGMLFISTFAHSVRFGRDDSDGKFYIEMQFCRFS